MVEVVDVSKIVNRLRSLAQDTENQPVIVRRGVLPSLFTFMQNDLLEVRIVASETIKLLSSHPDNKKLMAQDHQLLRLLCTTLKNKDVDNRLKSLAGEILVNLNEHISDEDMIKHGLSLKDVLSSTVLKQKQDPEHTTQKKRNVIFEVAELRQGGEQTRQLIQNLILQTKGTISYTISVTERKVHLYTRTSTEKLLEVFTNAKLSVQVIQDSVCETEYRKKALKESNHDGQKETKYLSPSKTQSQSSYKNSLVSHWNNDESFEERLARRKRQRQNKSAADKENEKPEEEKSTVSRFIGKITSVFW